MKKEFVFPILALSMICLVMAGTLAVVNEITSPIIEEAAAERASIAMRNIVYTDEFILIETDGMNLPDSIVSAHRTSDGSAYIFIVRVRGFGGEMRVMSGVDSSGAFLGSYILEHNETISFANRVFIDPDGYGVLRQSPLERDVVTGATITFRAYSVAVEYVFEAFAVIRGAGQ